MSYQLKPPFDILLKTREVLSNRDEETKLQLFEELVDSILFHYGEHQYNLDVSNHGAKAQITINDYFY